MDTNEITSNERTFKKIIRRKRKTLFPFFLRIFLRFIIPITVQESIHLFIYHIIYNSNFSTRERVQRKSIRRVRETLFPLPPLPPPNSPYFHTLFYSTTVPSHTPLCTHVQNHSLPAITLASRYISARSPLPAPPKNHPNHPPPLLHRRHAHPRHVNTRHAPPRETISADTHHNRIANRWERFANRDTRRSQNVFMKQGRFCIGQRVSMLTFLLLVIYKGRSLIMEFSFCFFFLHPRK